MARASQIDKILTVHCKKGKHKTHQDKHPTCASVSGPLLRMAYPSPLRGVFGGQAGRGSAGSIPCVCNIFFHHSLQIHGGNARK
jgi:hypothetical protein